ncbi:MAG: hypothetical protein GY932_13295 [Arcobacter sp.]|nr:hypothetical protein [Arcobacter sp.]
MSLVNTATNIAIGSLTTKIFDSFITSKFTQRQEKKKWLREKQLNLFSQLSEDVISINCQNCLKKKISIKENVFKIILLIEDKNLKTNLENYIFILDEYECFKDEIDIIKINKELMKMLGDYIKKI